jgi:hypothetical protein
MDFLLLVCLCNKNTISRGSEAGIGNIAYLCGKTASAFLAHR